MRSYVGGPYDGKTFTTRYDDRPIVYFLYFDIQDGKVIQMIAEYELKCGMRTFLKSYRKEAPGGQSISD